MRSTASGTVLELCARTTLDWYVHHPVLRPSSLGLPRSPQPIFHEGSKGYFCCKRRVLEFDEFLKIEGCKVGKHVFVPRKTSKDEVCLLASTEYATN